MGALCGVDADRGRAAQEPEPGRIEAGVSVPEIAAGTVDVRPAD